MSQQGEKPAAHEDDWWRKLYDEAAPDTGPSRAADSIDDRFDSASDAVGCAAVRAEAAQEPVQEPAQDPVQEPVQAPVREPAQRPAREPAPAQDPPAVRAGGQGPVVPVPDPRLAPPENTSRPPENTSCEPHPRPMAVPAPWEPPAGAPRPRTFAVPSPLSPAQPPPGDGAAGGRTRDTRGEASEPSSAPAAVTAPGLLVGHIGDRPPTYDAEPATLPLATGDLDGLVADTVLDGARYGTYTLRAASVRGDSARFRGEPRRDALITARFGTGEDALVLVAVAGGARAAGQAHLAAADACHWIGGAVGRSHARLSDDIRAGRRGDLKSGLQRLTDRTYGKLRARAAELGLEPDAYTVGLRCLLLPADPACRTRVFFGVGGGGLFRLRDGVWQDLEPPAPEAGTVTGEPVVGFGSAPPARSPDEQGPDGDRLTMDLQIATAPAPYVEAPVPPPAEPFRFRASVARPGDTLLLCSNGLAEPMRGEPALAGELAERWACAGPPGLAGYLADTQLRVKGYADDRTSAAVWEA